MEDEYNQFFFSILEHIEKIKETYVLQDNDYKELIESVGFLRNKVFNELINKVDEQRQPPSQHYNTCHCLEILSEESNCLQNKLFDSQYNICSLENMKQILLNCEFLPFLANIAPHLLFNFNEGIKFEFMFENNLIEELFNSFQRNVHYDHNNFQRVCIFIYNYLDDIDTFFWLHNDFINLFILRHYTILFTIEMRKRDFFDFDVTSKYEYNKQNLDKFELLLNEGQCETVECNDFMFLKQFYQV